MVFVTEMIISVTEKIFSEPSQPVAFIAVSATVDFYHGLCHGNDHFNDGKDLFNAGDHGLRSVDHLFSGLDRGLRYRGNLFRRGDHGFRYGDHLLRH